MPHPARASGVDVRQSPGSLPGWTRFETYERGVLIHFTELRDERVSDELPQWLVAYFREHPGTYLRLVG